MLPDFDKVFEVECNASRIGISIVFIQERKLMSYFTNKLNGAKLNYSTYDRELYAIVRSRDYLSHYLSPKPFILHSDHEALQFLHGYQNTQQKGMLNM